MIKDSKPSQPSIWYSVKMKKHFWLYVLELNDGKYYVGITAQRNPEDRVNQHKNGFYSAQWVKKYGYKNTLQIHDLGRVTEEDAIKTENIMTHDLMEQYGKDNVRGGVFNYGGRYFYRFGRFHRDSDWEAVTTVTLLMLIIIYFAVDKYLLG